MWDILKMYPNINKVITGKQPYSLLIPTAESLKDFNITTSMKDLLRFIDFHLIPNSEVTKFSIAYQERDIIILLSKRTYQKVA